MQVHIFRLNSLNEARGDLAIPTLYSVVLREMEISCMALLGKLVKLSMVKSLRHKYKKRWISANFT